jgi:sigma-B regulation protein RsbU (phosphoserine phosphatase)
MNDRRASQSPPQLAGYSSWLYQMPCQHSSGDLLVCMPLGAHADLPGRSHNRLLVALGDVSGRGEAASSLKRRLAAEVVRLASTVIDPASLLEALNDAPLDPAESDRFATLLVAVIDGDRHELTLANAGHVAPVLRHAYRRTEPLARNLIGFPLWVLPGQTYEDVTVLVGPGDLLIFHSNGVTSVINETECIFGDDRLRQAIAGAPDDAISAGQSIIRAIEGFRGRRAQMDATTLFCLGRMAPHVPCDRHG